MKITCVPTSEVRSVWSMVRHHLIPAIDLSGGRWTAEYVLAALALGEQTLWVATSDNGVVGAATVQIISYPERKNVAIHFLGGNDFDTWYSKMLSDLEEYGKAFGCNAIECNARHGFWKFFKEDGFMKSSTFYEKVI